MGNTDKAQQMLQGLLNNPRRERIKLIERGPPNPAHYYTIDGSSRGVISTTTLLHSYMPPFDADLTIANMMANPDWPKNSYYGMSPEEIKLEWAGSAPAGTAMHHNFEAYHTGQPYDATTPEMISYLAWQRKEPHYKTVASEYVLGSKAAMLGGAIDNLTQDMRDGKFIMVDYKRTRKLSTQSYCACNNPWGIREPFPHTRSETFIAGHDRDTCRGFGSDVLTEHLPACNHMTYSLQQHIYGHMLEAPRLYNFPLKGQYLWAVTPPTFSYYFAPVAPIRDVAKAIFAKRIREVRENCF